MAIIFQDTFTDTPGTDLTAHTPEVGTGWINDFTNQPGNSFVIDSTGTAAQATGPNRSNKRIAFAADTTYSTANYQVSTTLRGTTSDGDAPIFLTARYDADGTGSVGYFAGGFRPYGGPAEGQTPQGIMLMRLRDFHIDYLDANPNIGLTDGDTLRFVCTDDIKQVFLNGNLVLTSTDNLISAPGYAGFASGNFFNTLDDIPNDVLLEDFTVDTTITGEDTKDEVPFVRVSTGSDSQIQLYKWSGLTENNRGVPYINPRLTRKVLQVVGTFNGGSLEFQGTALPPAGAEAFNGQFRPLHNALGRRIELVENGVIDRLDHAFAYRPVVTSGSNVNLTVYLLSVEG